MNVEREKLYLAALLHDIGKFAQRADANSTAESKFLSDSTKKLESVFCPVYNGRATHKHVLWTVEFINRYKELFSLLAHDELIVDDKLSLLSLAAGHHLKKEQQGELGALIIEADHLSSGMDRGSEKVMEDYILAEGRNAFKKVRMASILEGVKRPNHKHTFSLPLRKLSLTEEAFPTDKFDGDPDYSSLWHDFELEFKSIQSDTYRAFSETLLSLLFKYTSSVPASTINFPDVSLFDHLKTTAALALCLYDYRQSGENGDEPFVMIAADFSGIQSYIYQIVSKNASKNLKGRSFYLKLLSDSIVRLLLKELDLFQANVIYNSGGSFYLLAPNTTTLREKLKSCMAKIEKQIFHAHGTSLYVALDFVAFGKDELMHRDEKSLKDVWGKLFLLRDKRKTRRYAGLLKEEFKTFFEPSGRGAEALRDTVSGEELLPGEDIYSFSKGKVSEAKDIDDRVKKITYQQKEIGRKLRETDLIVVSDVVLPYWKNEVVTIEPAGLGFYYYFLNQDDLLAASAKLKGSADHVNVITLNGKNLDCDFFKGTPQGANNIYSLEFYGGNVVPVDDDGDVKTFEDLVEGVKDEGFRRLGVLRMDVDNLGSIFQSGIPDKEATLSRYSALSRSLDWFFSGYLNRIWMEVAPETTYIVYSGGDDLFIVGKWNDTIKLAERIKHDFDKYTCFNPNFSVSGGTAIVNPTFPIMKGAEASEKEESKAKGYQNRDKSKNAFSFMEMPLGWDVEFPKVKAIKNQIFQMLSNDELPKSFLSKLYLHYAKAEIVDKDGRNAIGNLKTYWMMAYDFGRFKSLNKKNEKLLQLVDRCSKDITNNVFDGVNLHSKYHALELWYLAARWAELEYRTELETLNN